ncbi:MAG: hypothetical protein AB1792_08635 [Candidatus Zixiibacteriota bacterium]
MAQETGEPLDLSNPRYWRQNAQMAIRDIYDALVEIVTNADDRYVFLKRRSGRIELEVERRRKGTPNLIRVRDFADGMTLEVMRTKLRRVGDRVSGMEKGERVRGTNSRGAKDVAWLGGVAFESIAGDGMYHKCEITPQGRFIPDSTCPCDPDPHRARLKIVDGTGTVVTVQVDSEVVRVPQHDTLREDFSRLVALRDILSSPDREIVLYDSNNPGRSHTIRAPMAEGADRVNERFKVPGHGDVEAKLVIRRAKERLEDQRPRFRLGGILVKSKHAIHEATLFAPDLESDPYAKWFYGRLTCEHIDDLWNEYDDRFEKGLPPTEDNPRPILDPLRKEGLSREHPFVEALFREALKRLRPLVEAERKQAESQRASIESDDTRRRLRALEKAAAKFMSENREVDEIARDADDTLPDSSFQKRGFSLNPPFARVLVGRSVRFWLNVRQDAFPELAPGDTVEIASATDEVRVSRPFVALECHPRREGVLRCVWTVKGERPSNATGIKVRVGKIVADSTIEVLESEKDLYRDITRFCFSRKRYSVQVDSRRTVVLYAPIPGVVSRPTSFEITCTDKGFKLEGDPCLVPRPNVGIAECRLRVSASQAGRIAQLRAAFEAHTCEAELVSVDPLGATIEIVLDPGDYGNQRSFWRGNELHIATRHPSVRRYLGPGPKYPGQEEVYFRVLLAEIVADAVCARLLGRNETIRPEEYTDSDWDAYYAEYTAMMTRFLPIAHETQVKM